MRIYLYHFCVEVNSISVVTKLSNWRMTRSLPCIHQASLMHHLDNPSVSYHNRSHFDPLTFDKQLVLQAVHLSQYWEHQSEKNNNHHMHSWEICGSKLVLRLVSCWKICQHFFSGFEKVSWSNTISETGITYNLYHNTIFIAKQCIMSSKYPRSLNIWLHWIISDCLLLAKSKSKCSQIREFVYKLI